MNKNIERHLRNIRWLLSEVTTIQSSEDLLTPIVTGWLNKDVTTDQK